MRKREDSEEALKRAEKELEEVKAKDSTIENLRRAIHRRDDVFVDYLEEAFKVRRRRDS